MTQTPIAAARQQLVEVSGIPGYFATKTGGEGTAEVSKAWDGGSLKPESLGGPEELGNVTVTRPYRPAIHGPILKTLRAGVTRATVSVWDTDPDLGPIGEPVVYPNALLVRRSRPEADASSSTPSAFELEFAVDEEA